MQLHRAMVLLLGGASLVLLMGLLITLVVVRQPETAYAPNSPQAAAASFLRLLEQSHIDAAYVLTTKALDGQSFHRQFVAWHSTTHRVSLVQTAIHGDMAAVDLTIRRFAGGAVGLPEQSYQATLTLERVAGTWRVSHWYGMP